MLNFSSATSEPLTTLHGEHRPRDIECRRRVPPAPEGPNGMVTSNGKVVDLVQAFWTSAVRTIHRPRRGGK